MSLVVKEYKFMRLTDLSEDQFIKLLQQALENMKLSDGVSEYNLEIKVAKSINDTYFIIDKKK